MWKATDRIASDKPSEPDFEALFAEHSAVVFRAAFKVTGSQQDAEDVLQTVFLKLMQRQYPTDEAFANPAGYMYQAAINESLAVFRSRQRRREADVSEEPEPSASTSSSSLSNMDDGHLLQLRTALDKLEPDALAILILHYDEGYTGAEIAEMLGQSRSAVAMTLQRTRDQLRKRMGMSGETR